MDTLTKGGASALPTLTLDAARLDFLLYLASQAAQAEMKAIGAGTIHRLIYLTRAAGYRLALATEIKKNGGAI